MVALLFTPNDVEILKRKWIQSDEFVAWHYLPGNAALLVYTAGGHVGLCASFEEKVEKLKHTASNGIFLYYYHNIQNVKEFDTVETFY